MVHGLGGAATNWTDVMDLLRDRLARSRRTCPASAGRRRPRTTTTACAAHARAVTELVERVGAGRPVHLLGNSLGGTVSTVVAATRPDLVRTLTLVSPALPVLRPRLSNVHLPALAVPWAGQRLATRLGPLPGRAAGARHHRALLGRPVAGAARAVRGGDGGGRRGGPGSSTTATR